MLLPKRRIVEADAWSDRSISVDHTDQRVQAYTVSAERRTAIRFARRIIKLFPDFIEEDTIIRDSNVQRLSRWHSQIFRLTGGRIGKRLVANDMLLLTTRGVASGKPHTVPLLYLTSEESYVVIASYGGRPDHPQWYHNLVAEPAATIQVQGERYYVMARTISAEERSIWWPRIVDAYSGYAEYQSKTTREIPVVTLRRVGMT